MYRNYTLLTIIACLILPILSGCTSNTPATIQPTTVQPTSSPIPSNTQSTVPLVISPVESQIVQASSDIKALDLQAQTAAQEIWKFQTDGRITSSPLFTDGNIYFGSDDHKLYAVDHQSGKELWSFTADSQIRSSPKLSGTSIVFQSHKGTLYKLDASSGKKEWSVSFSGPVTNGEQDEWDYYDSSPLLMAMSFTSEEPTPIFMH